jgi:monoamine oxidase
MSKKKTHTLQTFLVRNPQTGNFSVIKSEKGKAAVTQAPAKRAIKETAQAKQHIVILGGGISGLTAAYDLLKTGRYDVTIVEANNRTGGRSLTLRKNDSFTEVINNRKYEQTCDFNDESNGPSPYPPYLNAGPGRIPSAHYHVLNLCKELRVDLEVYIMQTRSNLVQPKNSPPLVNRQVANDALGYITDDLFQFLKKNKKLKKNEKELYFDLLAQVGALTTKKDARGRIIEAEYKGSQRAGFQILPGAQPGVVNKPIKKAKLLSSKFWEQHFYQPEDFLWQPTSFQPVGGMDMIEKKLVEKISQLGGTILLNAPVTQVTRNGQAWKVYYGNNETPLDGDVCLCNIPLPLMKDKLTQTDFDRSFWLNLDKVMSTPKFLAPTCKVGWQAKRELWQKLPTHPQDATIPIFGGISYTSHPMTQMWYPSNQFHDEWGVLTGAYNYGTDAETWGNLSPQTRLSEARKGAEELHGTAFAKGLQHGITIAWQNIPTQKGGWADWSQVGKTEREQLTIMNGIRKGDNGFFVIGDQVSWLPGWKEGAVAIAQEVVALIEKVPNFAMLQIQKVPDTKTLIEGHLY